MRYLVQAILIDGDIETVVGSIKSDDYKATATFLMMMHRHGYKYLYRAMDIETGEIVMSTTKNEFQRAETPVWASAGTAPPALKMAGQRR